METFETVKGSSPLWDRGKLFIKAIIIFVMALFLWIPTYFIMNIVKEREGRQMEAIADISSKWADKQVVTGPVLMLPYRVTITDEKGQQSWMKQNAYFMADKMEINSVVFPEKRKRGIYEVAVYRTDLSITGIYNNVPWEKLNVAAENIL